MAEAGTIQYKLSGDTAQLERSLKKASTSVASFSQKMSKSLVGMGASFAGVGMVIKGTVGAFSNFESGISRAGAIAGATDTEVKQLEQTALQLAKSTKFSAVEVTDAYKAMAMAGQDAGTILTGIAPTLNLAAAGNIGLGDAANIATNIMAGFGIQAEEMAEVNDVLASAITGANVTVGSLGEAFKQVGPAAQAAGVPFRDVTTAISLLGNAGISAGAAGTALRNALMKLAAPTEEAQDVIRSMGLSLKNADGSMRPFIDIVGQLEQAQLGLEDATTLFGVRAAPAMLALVEQGSGTFAKFNSRLEESAGLADRLTKKEMATFHGQMLQLQAAAEGAAISFGEAMVPALRQLNTVVQDVLGWVDSLGAGVKQTMGAITLGTAVITGFGAAYAVLSGVLPVVVGAINALALPLAAALAMILGVRRGVLALKSAWDFFGAADKPIVNLNATFERLQKTFREWLVTISKVLAYGGGKVAQLLGFDVSDKDIAGVLKEIEASADAGGFGLFDNAKENLTEVAGIAAKAVKDEFVDAFADIKKLVGGLFGDFKLPAKARAKISAAPKQAVSTPLAPIDGSDLRAARIEAARIKELLSSFGGALQRGIEKIGEALSASAIPGVQKFGGAIKGVAGQVADTIGGAMASAAPKAAQTMDAAMKGFAAGGPWGAVIGAVASLITQTKGFGRMMAAVERTLGPVIELLDMIMMPLSDIVVALAPIIDILTKLWLPLFKLVGSIFHTVADIVEAITTSIAKTWNTLIEKIAKFVGRIKKSWGNDLRKMKVSLPEDVKAEIDGVTDKFKELNDALTNVPQGVKVALARYRAIDAGDVTSAAVSGQGAANNVSSSTTTINIGTINADGQTVQEILSNLTEHATTANAANSSALTPPVPSAPASAPASTLTPVAPNIRQTLFLP